MKLKQKRLLTRGESSPKIRHGDLGRYEAAVLHLLPHREGGFTSTLCPWSTPGCRATCLNYAGRGQMQGTQDGRLWKSALYRQARSTFIQQLTRELSNLAGRAARKNKQAVVRLDGTSDLGLAKLMAPLFPSIIFYDYTKSWQRYTAWLSKVKYPHVREWWPNRHLTFSRSEKNQVEAMLAMGVGGTVAVVFDTKKGQPLPKTWEGYKVVDGDLHDFRFLDPGYVVVGVRAKGRARKDESGFVVRV